MLPAEVVKRWQFHPQFSAEFCSWLTEYSEKYQVVEDAAAAAAADSSKRAGDPQPHPEESPQKKPKVAEIQYFSNPRDPGSQTPPSFPAAD